MRVEIWSDVVCPWCYLGQARFRKALASFPHEAEVQVEHRSFELDPGFPADQVVPVTDMLRSKYGLSPAQADAAEQRIAGLAAAQGLPFHPDRLHGSTLGAHRLLKLAAARGRQQEVIDALYLAQFGGGRSIFDPASLAAIGADAGLDEDEAAQVLAGDAFTKEVRADEQRARELGVTGVPFFLADGKLAVAGAQETATFGRLLGKAWDDAVPAR
ncbi:MAG TPA: DsbA family oxidoreductase [Streptosporangiaceae bacterium]